MKRYILYVSEDYGAHYRKDCKSRDLSKLKAMGRDLDKKGLRWSIADRRWRIYGMCRIHLNNLGLLICGDGRQGDEFYQAIFDAAVKKILKKYLDALDNKILLGESTGHPKGFYHNV